MSDEHVKAEWERNWEESKSLEDGASFIGIRLRRRRMIIVQDILSKLDHNMSVIDLGCGGGRTLTLIRNAGFKNSIGIDFTQHSIDRCKTLGFIPDKDVFLMDAGETTFPDKHFGIVFSEGLWEHFPDPRPYMTEAARISKDYIIVIQPDHFTIFGRLMFLGWNLLRGHGVKEYSFRMSYFINFLDKCGFDLVEKRCTVVRQQMIMVFRRRV